MSRGYFERINGSNTVISNTVINNYNNNTANVTNIVYANRDVAGAIFAVPTTAFVQLQPLGRSAVRVPREPGSGGAVAFSAPVAPTERNVRGTAAKGDNPPPRAFERPVVARTVAPRGSRRVRGATAAADSDAGQTARRHRPAGIQACGIRARTRRQGGRTRADGGANHASAAGGPKYPTG